MDIYPCQKIETARNGWVYMLPNVPSQNSSSTSFGPLQDRRAEIFGVIEII